MATAEVFAHPGCCGIRAGEILRSCRFGRSDTALELVGWPMGSHWPLRLAAVWQQVLAAPVRSTQGNNALQESTSHRFEAVPGLS